MVVGTECQHSPWHVADVQATVSNRGDTLEIVHALGCFPFENLLLPDWPWSSVCSRRGGIRNISESCREAEVIQFLTCIIGLGSERLALEGWAWSGAGITNSLFPCLESSPTNTFIEAFRRKTKAIQGIWCEDVRLSSLFTSL